MIDIDDVIGLCPLTNTGVLVLHRIDYSEDKLLVSINGNRPQWCKIVDVEKDGEYQQGIYFGKFLVLLSDFMRF